MFSGAKRVVCRYGYCKASRFSVSESTGEEGTGQLMDIICDMSKSSSVRKIDRIIQNEIVIQHVNCLAKKESAVLKLRFGLEDGIFRTLEEIGGEMNLTRERIRQIESSGLRKLRVKLIHLWDHHPKASETKMKARGKKSNTAGKRKRTF